MKATEQYFSAVMFVVQYTVVLTWYYDQKVTFAFHSGFEALFAERSPSEVLSLNF